MKIILDAMGGDHAPACVVQGAVQARQQLGVELILVGREQEVTACFGGAVPEGIAVVPAAEVVDAADDPATAFKKKPDSSLTVGLTLLKNGGGDAFVSAGPTGALLAGATLLIKRIPGIRRAAMGPLLPTAGGRRAILCDCGANSDCTPEYLLQFAFLGSFYARHMMGIETPRVGLLNIGAEPSKGDQLRHETYALLREAQTAGRLHFIGNVEAHTALLGGADVIVSDGYSGNILLKTLEGTARLLLGELKGQLLSSFRGKMGALLSRDALLEVKKLLDPGEVGATAFLGIRRPVLKAHGASDARAICNAVRRAVEYAGSGLTAEVEAHIDEMRVEKNG